MKNIYLLLVGVLFVTACGNKDEPYGWPSELRAEYIAECQAGGGSQSICGCTAESLERSFPYPSDFENHVTVSDILNATATCTPVVKGWSTENKNLFISECTGDGVSLEKCSCALKQLEIKFPNPDMIQSLGDEVAIAFAKCPN